MPIFLQDLRESWRSLILWSIALVSVLALYVYFYSLMGTTASMSQFMDSLPESISNAFDFRDIGTGAGWAQSTFFGILGYFIFVAAAVSFGARGIAGDEESGFLELTLAHRVARTQLYWERTASLMIRIVILAGIVGLGLWAMDGPAGLGLELANIPPQILAYLGLGIICGSLAQTVGAATGIRARAVAAGGGLAVAGFLLNALGSVDESYEWMHLISPYSWAYQDRPLANGWDVSGLALLYGSSVLLWLIGWAAFSRRDITAG